MFNSSKYQSNLTVIQNSSFGKRASAGFTLIELMISIVLGLLLVAAASQLFFTGVVSSRVQQAGADMQDNGLFGLEFIAKGVRLANYGNANYLQITDRTPLGGIVLTTDTSATDVTSNLPMVRTTSTAADIIPIGLVSSGTAASGATGDAPSLTVNEWQGLSNVTNSGGTAAINSDQLTISYQAPTAMTNCAGYSVNAGDYVVERYFLRADSVGPASVSGVSNLVLACDAGKMISGLGTIPAPAGSVAASTSTTTPITPSVICAVFATPATSCAIAFGGAGQVIMARVDHVHFLLGTILQDGTQKMAYYTINAYKNLTVTPKPQIVSIKIAALVRSLDNTGNAMIDPNATFTMFDQTVKPVAATGGAKNNRYMRKVYLTTVALRNATGSSS